MSARTFDACLLSMLVFGSGFVGWTLHGLVLR